MVRNHCQEALSTIILNYTKAVQMNDKQVQDLIRGQFMNAMIFRIMDNAKVRRCRIQQVQKMPLILDIIGGAVILFWSVLLGGTLLLSLIGLVMSAFNID